MNLNTLTPERLFSDPPLTGGEPVDLKFSPDGKFVSYRRAAEDDRERMDLWQVDLASGVHREWVNATTLTPGDFSVSALTDEERAERERRRQFNHGITQYSWHPDGRRLLLPIDGQALLVDVSTQPQTIQNPCPVATRQSGFQLSPDGDQLSYVRQGDLYIVDIATGTETRITQDASETLSNGLPDFLAAEEMHRFQGHWWSPDGDFIAFCKVDESVVEVSYRLEMQAASATTVAQRYPYAGQVNPHVSLWLYNCDTKTVECIWEDCGIDQSARMDPSADAYLARVTLASDRVFIQTQDRLQQHLRLQSCLFGQQTWQLVHQEVSDTWVNLTDDLRLLGDQRLLFSSESSGTNQLVCLDQQGTLHALLCPQHINKIVAVNASTAFVTGWDETPLENHFYAIDLQGQAWRQLTQDSGWHEVILNQQKDQYLSRYSDPKTPVKLQLHAVAQGSAERDQAASSRVIYKEDLDSEHPYSDYLSSHAYPSFGQLEAADGQAIYYRLTPPAQISGQHATIVYVYGGPGPQKAKREWSPLTVQLFAQNGFGVLEIDNRGTGNRGRQFEAPIYRDMASAEVADQVVGLQALNDVSWADPQRVGIYGHSYGGYMTLMCLSRASEHFQAGVAVAPVSDWHLYDSHYTERYMGLPEDNKPGYLKANVLSHLSNLNAPLLLMHGMADDNVLFTNSTMIMAHLQKLGIPFELMTYPGAKHSMQERDVSIHRFNMILEFFSRTLNS